MLRKGFTLIEVLIVVSIIAVLASILIVAVMGTIDPAKVKTTDQRIKIIEEGLKRFVDKYPVRQNVSTESSGKGYPRQDEYKDVKNDAGVLVEQMYGGEFLRLILFPSATELEALKAYGITEAVMSKDEVGELLNETDFIGDEHTAKANSAFVDSWGFPFYYLFPGSDHSGQKNWRDEKGANHKSKMNPKPDIWSRGSNNEDDINQWNDPNDPFSETEDSVNDDITNWFQNER